VHVLLVLEAVLQNVVDYVGHFELDFLLLGLAAHLLQDQVLEGHHDAVEPLHPVRVLALAQGVILPHDARQKFDHDAGLRGLELHQQQFEDLVLLGGQQFVIYVFLEQFVEHLDCHVAQGLRSALLGVHQQLHQRVQLIQKQRVALLHVFVEALWHQYDGGLLLHQQQHSALDNRGIHTHYRALLLNQQVQNCFLHVHPGFDHAVDLDQNQQ